MGYNPNYKWINLTYPIITGVITHLLSGMSHQVGSVFWKGFTDRWDIAATWMVNRGAIIRGYEIPAFVKGHPWKLCEFIWGIIGLKKELQPSRWLGVW